MTFIPYALRRHVFHKECILNWLTNASTCPYCRSASTKTSLMEYFLPENTPSALKINPNSGTVPKNTERVILSKNARKKRTDANRNLSFPPIVNNTNTPNLEELQNVLENASNILPTTTSQNVSQNNVTVIPLVSETPTPTVNVSQSQDDVPSTSQAALERRITQGLENKFTSEFSKINEIIMRMSEQLNQINVHSPPFSRFDNPPLNSILSTPIIPVSSVPVTRSVNFYIPTTTSENNTNSTVQSNIFSTATSLSNTATTFSTRPISTNFSSQSFFQNSQPNSNISVNSYPQSNLNTFRTQPTFTPFPTNSNINLNNSPTESFNIHPNINRNPRSNSSISSSDLTNRSKIAHLVSSWNLTYAGSNTGIPVEKFIFMVNALVQDTLGGDFSVLSEHCHILFTGKAKQWFWDYRLRNPERIEWHSLCYALEAHYNDHLSDIDIRKILDARKQNVNETFDDFYHDVLRINDRLRRKLTEAELVDTLKRNVKPYLRKELFYLQIHSVSELRNLVLRREALSLELDGYNNQRFVRRQVNEVQVEVQEQSDLSEVQSENISEVRLNNNRNPNHLRKPDICFNCKLEGHRFRQCPEKLTLFCFNCGKHGVYNFNCDNCPGNRQSREGNNTSLHSLNNQ